MENVNTRLNNHVAPSDGISFQDGLNKVSSLVTEVASDTARKLKESGDEVMHQVKEKGGEYAKELENRVKSDPVRSALICAGIGFLLGRFIR